MALASQSGRLPAVGAVSESSGEGPFVFIGLTHYAHKIAETGIRLKMDLFRWPTKRETIIKPPSISGGYTSPFPGAIREIRISQHPTDARSHSIGIDLGDKVASPRRGFDLIPQLYATSKILNI